LVSKIEVLDKYLEQAPPEIGIDTMSFLGNSPMNERLVWFNAEEAMGKASRPWDDRHSGKKDETGAVGLIVAQR
jgi:hypothetical protein